MPWLASISKSTIKKRDKKEEKFRPNNLKPRRIRQE